MISPVGYSPLELARVAAAFRRHLHASPEKLAAFRDERLRRVIDHAYRNVPYYRRLFDEHGISPGDIRGAADLWRVPVTKKEELRQVPEVERVSLGLRPEQLIARSSSGSTGAPFTVLRTWREQNVLHLLRRRALRSYGVGPRDRTLNISHVKEVHPRDNKALGSTLAALGLFRRRTVSIALEPAEMLAQVRAWNPTMLGGYPNVLAQVATLVARDGAPLAGLRMLLSGAEVLTPDLRQRIESGFGVPVRDLYGCHECNLVAWECAETGALHSCDDAVIVEVLDPDGQPVREGDRGEVVLTTLHTYSMPFVRYRLGDLAEAGRERCECGAPFGTIRAVQGRMLDLFPLPDGRVIHPYALSVKIVLAEPRWIDRYRLTQERLDRIVMTIVPRMTPTAEMLDATRGVAARVLGPGVEFEVELVSELRAEPSGKVRTSRSYVSSSYDGLEWRSRRETASR